MTDKEFAWQVTLEWQNMTQGWRSPMNKIRRCDKWILRLAWIGAWLLLWCTGACTPNTEVINYRTYTDPERGIFYIVDGQVLDRAMLISGVGADQQRVVVTRQGH